MNFVYYKVNIRVFKKPFRSFKFFNLDKIQKKTSLIISIFYLDQKEFHKILIILELKNNFKTAIMLNCHYSLSKYYIHRGKISSFSTNNRNNSGQQNSFFICFSSRLIALLFCKRKSYTRIFFSKYFPKGDFYLIVIF